MSRKSTKLRHTIPVPFHLTILGGCDESLPDIIAICYIQQETIEGFDSIVADQGEFLAVLLIGGEVKKDGGGQDGYSIGLSRISLCVWG